MARLRWLIIPIFIVFLMSHNANALVTTLDMTGYEIINSANSVKVNCRFANPVTEFSNVDICDSSTLSGVNIYLRGIESVNEWSFIKNDLVEFNILVYSATSLSSLDGFVIGALPSRGGFRTIEFTELSSGIFDQDLISITNGTGGTDFNGNAFYSVYHVVMRYLNTPTANFKVGLPLGNQNFFAWSGGALGFRLFNLNQYRLSGDGSIDQQNEINATQEQSEAGDSASNSSADDVSNATQSLASAMGSIVSVIKDTPASDCNISISTTGSSAGFTSAIGALNLCSGVPSNILNTIRGLAALVIVPYVLYAAYSICIKMYRTFTEVQNT